MKKIKKVKLPKEKIYEEIDIYDSKSLYGGS